MAMLNFAPFNYGSETWKSYTARFECFLVAHDLTELTDERKCAFFLSVCGTDVFHTARALTAPEPIKAVPWPVLLAKLMSHYAPSPSKIARRHAFHQRSQAEGESVSAYVAALRSAALHCEFRDLDEALLDRLVCGLRDLKLQKRLLTKADLSFQSVFDEVRAAEMSTASLATIAKSRSTPTAQSANTFSTATGLPDTESDDSDAEGQEEDINRLYEANKKSVTRRKGDPKSACGGCGGNHERAECRFRQALCQRCGRKGHIAWVCRAAQPMSSSELQTDRFRHPRNQTEGPKKPRMDCHAILRNANQGLACHQVQKKIQLTVNIEGRPCEMELDTGSATSIVSWSMIKRLLPQLSKRQLQDCNLTLRDYQGNLIPVIGTRKVRVQFKGFSGRLPLIIVEGRLPSLLGLDWFQSLGLQISGIHNVGTSALDCLVNEFPAVFDGTLGRYTDTPVSFNLDPAVQPVRMKPRRVPIALKPKVDTELDKLVAQGVLEPVDHARWETPIVLPIKPDGSVRICADYRCSINRALPSNAYPVPVVQHLLHTLGEGSIFAKLDLAQEYQQLVMDDDAAEAQTIIMHRGAFRCRRLQFGVSIAPGLFQSLMERLLQGLRGVVPYFDDVLISAASLEELMARLREVLRKFQQVGLKVKRDKCQIAVPQIEFLGFLIDGRGIHPTAAKTKAIVEAPAPTNRAELQTFLGLLNFYAMFLPHKASVAEPLHRLLDSGAAWVWGRREATAFLAVKHLLISNDVLIQYSEHLPLVLACDASPYGVGAVLCHQLPSGAEVPIAFFSRTLSASERNYAQIDKEALAIVAGVRRFHHYLYGRPFLIVTDHKPLLGLLAGDRPAPQVLSPRMTRWFVFLASYDYQLHHRPGKQIAHADALSRCPLPEAPEDPVAGSPVFLIDNLNLPISAADITRLSARDQVISRVLDWVRRGWPKDQVDPAFLPFKSRLAELSVQRGCLLWGHRVVVPPSLRTTVLQQLHQAHPGIVRMKALGRSYVWWPKLDQDIAAHVADCTRCQSAQALPPKAEPRTWEPPSSPWSRVHVDFAGPIQGRMLFIAVDAFSKWVEVVHMPSTTADALVATLCRLFATHGLPDVLVSDNGPQLTSATFEAFLASQGIRHALTSPFHPASNGLAERAVRSVKEALAKMDHLPWQQRIDAFLLAHHSTPSPETNTSPAELLMGRRLRTTLDCLHPAYIAPSPLDSRGGSGSTTAELGDATATSCGADTSRQPSYSHLQTHTFKQTTRGPEAREQRTNRLPGAQTEATTYLVGWHRPWLVDDPSDRHPAKKGPRQGIQIFQAALKGLECPAESGGGQRIYRTTHARA
ncbi:uncharacterized protein K02A2.6-like [Thamnophis elegans]|uniref:uncharacterized protein K02A2.6-like n=1 Tax=Thamnophis elegans TaxID=35005 RepID=UPI001377B929|nr:uncharacterized protein K02A2.6-like [Thamnophis elegans]